MMQQYKQQTVNHNNEQPQKIVKIDINDSTEAAFGLSGGGKRTSPKLVDNNNNNIKSIKTNNKPDQIELNKLKSLNNNDKTLKESMTSQNTTPSTTKSS